MLEALSRGLTQKMLHGAMAELHAGDAEPRASAPAQAIAALLPAQRALAALPPRAGCHAGSRPAPRRHGRRGPLQRPLPSASA